MKPPRPLPLLLLTRAAFTFKVLPRAWNCTRVRAHARTHHTAFTVQAQAGLTYMHRLSALTYCLSQSGPGVAVAAENFDVFTAGAINHEAPYKCLVVPGRFSFFPSLTQ